ncbi:hypothetical protein H0H87_008556 [Tephrocybe sp. NHM501043]|nr:hypothetical protein H0H87_008556 [Tephrocybe sp. NHM501043]
MAPPSSPSASSSSIHKELVSTVTKEARQTSSQSPSEILRIQRKIDLRILPWLCFTYLVMRIDVNNISNAAIMNVEVKHDIKTQLGKLTAGQWNWAIACFFYPYAFLEPISTLMMKKTAYDIVFSLGCSIILKLVISPSFWLGRLMVTWGIIVGCIAAVQNYDGLITVRVLLGVAEAGYYPCVIYYLAFWFRPDQMARRVAAFYSFGQVSGFVGGFLAFAISYADGRLAGWRWLFIIEGIPAVLMGIATFWVLPDYPQTARFLSDDEKSATLNLLSEHSPSKEAKTWDWQQVVKLFKDPTFWTWTLVWFFHAVGGFGLSYALPTVIFQLGFTTSALSNVLSMPPSLLTFTVLNILGWLVQSHKFNPFRVAIVCTCQFTFNHGLK